MTEADDEMLILLFIIQAAWMFPALGILGSFFMSPEGTVHAGIAFPIVFLPSIIAIFAEMYNAVRMRVSSGGESNAE